MSCKKKRAPVDLLYGLESPSSFLGFHRHRTKWPLLLIAMIGLNGPLGLIGCASNETDRTEVDPNPSVSQVLASAPAWVTRGCRAFWSDIEKRRQVVCGIGSSPKNRNRVAARDTAIARARAAIARSLEVTIESLVRLEDQHTNRADLQTISHQLSSTSLRGAQLESVWQAETGEVHALVSLDLGRVQTTVRDSRSLDPIAREDLALRAADAFAELDAAFESEESDSEDESRP